MGNIAYRANLHAATFPLVSQLHGQTVIVPGPDQAYSQGVSSRDNVDIGINIPQLYYGHNFLPTVQGVHSVAYQQKIAAVAASDLQTIFPYYDNGVRGYISFAADGDLRGFKDGESVWTAITTLTPASGARLTTATLGGKTYILYHTPPTTNVFLAINLSTYGTTTPTYTGLSSTTDIFDFTPSLTTGAGGASVQEIRGKILTIVPSGFGAIIYTDVNAVAMTYTGNAKFPFSFREIRGSAGITSTELIAFDANSQSQIAFTTSGMQSLTETKAESFLPEITDFVAAQYFEDFDESTDTFSYTRATSPFVKKLTLVGDRFLVFSYGLTALTHALIYDLALARFGKLKIAHKDCFEYQYYSAAGNDTSSRAIAFMQADGRVVVAKISEEDTTDTGVFLFGKYQYVRSRDLALTKVTVENVFGANTITVADLASLDGKTSTKTLGYLSETNGTQKQYLFDTVGKNHSILIKGAVHLTNMVLEFFPYGKG